ncbi:MAG: carboxypeptidase regulatory-like domain-containing protein [Planctomycetaceae bacterium]
MRSRALLVGALLLCASGATAFLISSSAVGSGFVPERVPANRRPIHLLVDTEAVPGVADPRAAVQQLIGLWNAVAGAEDVFGNANIGGPYNGANVGSTFGTFTNNNREVAWDDNGQIVAFYGLSGGVLGITIKSVDTSSGEIRDLLIVVNTQAGALFQPGSGATPEELLRATLLHELGHATGIGHTPTGIVNATSYGFSPAAANRIATMYAFRIPGMPQEGGTLELDDRAALLRIYPADVSAFGSISGRVRSASGASINQIAVRAVSDAGEQVGILTNVDGTEQGRFTIPNLPPGGYRVILESVNGRAFVDASVLEPGGDGLGANPFLYAYDEHWRPGDSFDPSVDDPSAFATVQVRTGRDTGFIDVILDALPILLNQTLVENLDGGDHRVPDGAGILHHADLWVFQGSAGQTPTITATSASFTPQLLLLLPSDMRLDAQQLPVAGASAVLSRTLGESGIYTVVVYARGTAGTPNGSGAYTLQLQGAGAALPAPPVVTGASVASGPANPGGQAIGSPVCFAAMQQLRITAPSHEELWVDALTVRASGTGEDSLDVPSVALVRDLDGNGRRDGGEPVLASGSYAADDGSVSFGGLDLELAPGSVADLLVVYEVTVLSVPATPAAATLVAAPLLLLCLLLLVRRRGAALLLIVAALGPLSCGGGGGGNGCNPPFNASGNLVTFLTRVEASALRSFTPSTNPATPLALPPAPLQSSTLTVSR